MENVDKILMNLGKVGGGVVAYFLGGFGVLMQTLLLFVIIDFITGVLKAIEKHSLDSAVMRRGIVKKVLIFVVVAIAVRLQIVFADKIPLREIVIIFYIVNEGLSALENVGTYVNIPEPLRKVLIQLKKSNELKTNDTESEK